MNVIKGDSFKPTFRVSINKEVQDITGWTIESSIGKKSGPFQAFTVILLEEKGAFQLVGDTTDWPIGLAQFDIRYTTDKGDVCTTPTVEVLVKQGVTP